MQRRAPRSHTVTLSILLVAVVAAGDGLAQVPTDLALEPVASVTRPVVVRHAGDGSQRLFLVEQPGVVRIYDTATGTLLASPFLDIQSLVDDSGNEQGLLGLAFHPLFASNGFFFVSYTRDPGAALDRSVVARYQVSAGNPNVADPGSAVTVLELEQDFSNHNGGDIHFGPDGYLYLGLGDGGSAGDPLARAQDPMQLLGKMLRIDVDGPPATGGTVCGLVANYAIPADNPFVGDPGACDEIWALGLRNPWRFSFDRLTGDLFIADVGQNAIEEIDLQPAGSGGGENYGWSCKEGTTTPGYNPCRPDPLVDPILEYDHGLGCSVTGGYRYRGLIAGLHGLYAYADYCSGRIWLADDDTGHWSASLWQVSPLNVSAFGEDEAGELYVADLNGTVYRFASAEVALFLDGFESGDTGQWDVTVD